MKFEMIVLVTDMEHPDQTGLSGDIASMLEKLASQIRETGEEQFLPFFTESLKHKGGFINSHYDYGRLLWSVKIMSEPDL